MGTDTDTGRTGFVFLKENKRKQHVLALSVHRVNISGVGAAGPSRSSFVWLLQIVYNLVDHQTGKHELKGIPATCP
jgi:hypothetical protein